MTSEKLDYEIVHNEPHGLWEIRLQPDGKVIGYLSYDLNDTEIYIISTTVHKDYRGRGLAEELVRTVLDYEKEQGVHKIVPICAYVQRFVAENPGYPIA